MNSGFRRVCQSLPDDWSAVSSEGLSSCMNLQFFVRLCVVGTSVVTTPGPACEKVSPTANKTRFL